MYTPRIGELKHVMCTYKSADFWVRAAEYGCLLVLADDTFAPFSRIIQSFLANTICSVFLINMTGHLGPRIGPDIISDCSSAKCPKSLTVFTLLKTSHTLAVSFKWISFDYRSKCRNLSRPL